jgi:hypothetical protein
VQLLIHQQLHQNLSFGSRIGNNIIRLYGTDFGFGINGGTLRYNVPTGSVHRFYNGATNTVTIDDAGKLKATTFEGLILYLQFNTPSRRKEISVL